MKKLESVLKKILLNLLVLFNPVKKQNSLPDFETPTNVLFIRLNRIGDALVSTPLFDQIKQNNNIKIFVLADKKNHFVFINNPVIDKIFIFKKGLKGFFEINKIIKSHNISVVVDLHDDVSTSVSYLVAISKVRYKFALNKSNYKLFTHTVDKLDSGNNHVIDRVLELLKLFNLKLNRDLVSVKFYPNESDKRVASDKIKSLNPDSKFLIGINISAGSDARFWGVDNYKKLFSLLTHYKAKIILFSSQREHQYCYEITSADNIYPLTDSFGIFASAIMMMNFIITPDTSVVHLAPIKKIPLFGLYVKYITTDMIWSPYNTDFEYVLTDEPTLKNISFEEVKNKLVPFLEKHLNVTSNSCL